MSQAGIDGVPCLNIKKGKFKHAVRFIKRYENIIRSDYKVFFLLHCKAPLPTNIDGISGIEEITQLWQKHYYELFNCVRRNQFTVADIKSNEDVNVSSLEMYDAIMSLKDNKACGMDKISKKKKKTLSPTCYLLYWRSNSWYYPWFYSVTLVSIIKDKVGKISSLDNYRPIALASILSKTVLNRLEEFVMTNLALNMALCVFLH